MLPSTKARPTPEIGPNNMALIIAPMTPAVLSVSKQVRLADMYNRHVPGSHVGQELTIRDLLRAAAVELFRTPYQITPKTSRLLSRYSQ